MEHSSARRQRGSLLSGCHRTAASTKHRAARLQGGQVCRGGLSGRLQRWLPAQHLRDALLQIPSRLAPVLAAETNLATVTQLMEDELRQALAELSRDDTARTA